MVVLDMVRKRCAALLAAACFILASAAIRRAHSPPGPSPNLVCYLPLFPHYLTLPVPLDMPLFTLHLVHAWLCICSRGQAPATLVAGQVALDYPGCVISPMVRLRAWHCHWVAWVSAWLISFKYLALPNAYRVHAAFFTRCTVAAMRRGDLAHFCLMVRWLHTARRVLEGCARRGTRSISTSALRAKHQPREQNRTIRFPTTRHYAFLPGTDALSPSPAATVADHRACGFRTAWRGLRARMHRRHCVCNTRAFSFAALPYGSICKT